MSTEANKAMIRQWVDEAWNNGDFSHAEQFYTADYTYHDPSAPAGMPKGPQGIIGMVSMYRVGLPDVHMTIEDMVAEGDKVVWRWSVVGTHNGPLMGIPPTGIKSENGGIIITRFVNGKWAEDWNNWDTLGMLQRLGVIPAQT